MHAVSSSAKYIFSDPWPAALLCLHPMHSRIAFTRSINLAQSLSKGLYSRSEARVLWGSRKFTDHAVLFSLYSKTDSKNHTGYGQEGFSWHTVLWGGQEKCPASEWRQESSHWQRKGSLGRRESIAKSVEKRTGGQFLLDKEGVMIVAQEHSGL